MSKKISAIVCTHNRAEYLKWAVESLLKQALPREDYEVIVVDNASTDNTKNVIGSLVGQPDGLLRYVFEEQLGLSAARNRGLKEARGRYVAFLDDDAVACGTWLEGILDIFESLDPTPGCVSGKILPIWEGARPEWLEKRLEGHLALQDWGDEAHFIGSREWFAGANVSYPKDILEEAGGFDVSLGRIGNNLLSMEENLVREKLEAMGYAYYYDPAVMVEHHIRTERLNRDWFVRRSYWNGVSQAVIDRKVKGFSILARSAKAVRVLLRMATSPADLRGILLPADKNNDLITKCSVNARLGYVRGLFKKIP